MVGFVKTPAGHVPRVSRDLSRSDHLGTIGARSGIFRNSYSITPGLYALGNPTAESHVMVTANYKLTFDTVRRTLGDLNIWILVVDTRGINVWCAAGKGTFSTEEVSYMVHSSRLTEIVSHRRLILPQLAATGVAALQLRKSSGFEAFFGPVQIRDLPLYLENEMHASEEMRGVTFSFSERLTLVPVEICLLLKPLLILLLAIFVISGIGPDFYSLGRAVDSGVIFLSATMIAILAGAVITPLCLPWIPSRQFWLKGVQVSLILSVCLIISPLSPADGLAAIASGFWIISAGSYLAMNFTGSTPYTSLAGVEAEMRKGLPVQIIGALIALVLWVIIPFI